MIISECEGIPFAECLDILNSLIKTKYKCRLFVGISGKFSGWREIHMAYLDALKFIQDKRMGKTKKYRRFKSVETDRKCCSEGEYRRSSKVGANDSG